MKKPIDIQVTKEGFENLKKEYQELQDKRPEVLARMVAAREQGDLSENAGYHASKEELATTDHRLRELKLLIRFADVVNKGQIDKVGISSVVTIDDGSDKHQYTIVGQLEADPANGKLSDISPIGQALMGKKVGDQISIDIPDGKVNYKIIAIKSG